MSICLTFDSDHMSQQTLAAWLKECPIPGEATFFCGEPFDCFTGSPHEIAPHPDLMIAPSWKEEVAKYREMFPKAKSWRAHSLAFSQSIAVELHRIGYENVSMNERFGDRSIEVYRLPWGVRAFDIYYMDNADFCNFNDCKQANHVVFDKALIEDAVAASAKGDSAQVFVFDFHPIHIAMNTISYESYARERDNYKKTGIPDLASAERYGVRSFYLDLVGAMQKNGVKSRSLAAVAAQRARR